MSYCLLNVCFTIFAILCKNKEMWYIYMNAYVTFIRQSSNEVDLSNDNFILAIIRLSAINEHIPYSRLLSS